MPAELRQQGGAEDQPEGLCEAEGAAAETGPPGQVEEEADGPLPAEKKKKRSKKGKGEPPAAPTDFTSVVAAVGGLDEKLKSEGGDGEEGGEAVSKKKKKKKGGAGGKTYVIPEQDNSIFRKVGNWKPLDQSRQSPDFSVPVVAQYPDGDYPVGVCSDYIGTNAFRTTSAEKREEERLHSYDYENIRRAAVCHLQVRKFAQTYIRPGLSMIDICQRLERKTHELIQASGLECGWGFPTGCSLNHVAAHYSPNYGDTTVLQQGDICKLDFGVQVQGRIVDSAFTIAFDEKFDPLIAATQDGTNTGLANAGIDARLGEIGGAIQEAIESYEVELNGKVYPVRPIRNLNGHSIGVYRIHAGKSVPLVKSNDASKMEENEIYAIETFASTGKAYVCEDMECSHYMKIFDSSHVPLRVKSAKALLQSIEKSFGSLAFCRRWLDDLGHSRHLMSLKNLVDNELVQAYPPLCDQKGSYVSQMEHTVILRPTCKEVISRGDDY